MTKKIKIILFPILLAILLIGISMYNYYIKKNSNYKKDTNYQNAVNKDVLKNNFNDIAYDDLVNDLNNVSDILNNELKKENDIVVKTNLYKQSYIVYINKINEIISILNNKLDDEDFVILQNNISEFEKNIDFAKNEMSNRIKSSVELDYNINKYIYEEYRNKSYEILNTYKGFLS